MTHTLLFEVGTEELPPSELPTVLAALREDSARELAEARLSFERLAVYSTPRRLTLFVEGLADHQPSRRSTVTGPPKRAAFDAAGKPTRAAEGFARTHGVTVDQLVTITTERGDYIAVDRVEEGQAAGDVLPSLLARLATSLPFAKQMRWGEGDVRFSRPVRWVVALLDDAVLPVVVAGVTAGRVTYGHRFLAPDAITLLQPNDYVERLERASVVPGVEKRRQLIRERVEAEATAKGYQAVIDDATLDIVVHLVESPAAVLGTFDDEYLKLPSEVWTTPIQHHQKSFIVKDGSGSYLVPAFITVSNMPGIDPINVRRGSERVIRARLADAKFYFEEDKKLRLEDRLPLLEGMVFQERLGTLREKTDRIVALAEHLGSGIDAKDREILLRAAKLSKCDLASGMVREFPELQGIIGSTYANKETEDGTAVALAIAAHYRPRSADDDLPSTVPGALLSIADKIDTIVGIIGVGLTPTGSQDPYALRRQAQGVIQIAIAFGDRVRLSLDALVRRALELLAAKLTEPVDVTHQRVLEFLRVRIATILTARGRRPDVVEAVLASGFDQPYEVERRVEALTSLMSREDWEPLVVTFKRTINILPPKFSGRVDPARFTHDAERRLHDAVLSVTDPVEDALKARNYTDALGRLATLRPLVDAFFDAVMVMDKDPAVRDNRLGLLRGLADLLLPVADLRKIQATPSG